MLTRMRPRGGSGGPTGSTPHRSSSTCSRGSLAITVDGTATTLDTGDCVTFGATQLHDWHNPTDGESEVLWAIVPPIPHEQFRIGFRGD